MSQIFETVIRAGHLLPMTGQNPYNKLINSSDYHKTDQAIAIKNGKIAWIGPWKDFEKTISQPSSIKIVEFIDATQNIVLPGFINAHGHLPMTLFRGLADDEPFQKWLFDNILPLEARLVSPDFVKLGTELACLESLECGVTTVADMYYFEDSIAEACQATGIRAFLGETVIDFPVPDDKSKDGSCFDIARRMLARVPKSETLHFAISPHAPYSCSDATLKKTLQFSEDNDLPIQIHVSETLSEVDEHKKKYGVTPLQRLHDLGLTRRPMVMAHCVHLTDKEIEIAAQCNLGISYNPESNMKLAAGIAPVTKFLKAGIPVALGTDGAASNNDIGLFGEMDTAAKLQKLAQSDNTAIRAIDVLWMATRGGAKVLGLDKITGSIEVGKAADIICVSKNFAHLEPLHDPISTLVYSARGSEVEFVFVNGKKVVSNFSCLTVKASELREKIKIFRERNKF